MIEAAHAAQLEIKDELDVLAPEQFLPVLAEELEHVFRRGAVQVVDREDRLLEVVLLLRELGEPTPVWATQPKK